MTIQEYLLLKNTLNLQLSIALAKFDIICTRGNEYNICGKTCGITILRIETEDLYNSLASLDVCYREHMSLEKTIETIGFGLLPQK
jgi:hypothetical protein